MTNTIKILIYILNLNSMTEIRTLLDCKKQHGIRMPHPIIISMGGMLYEFMHYQFLENYSRASGFRLIRRSEDMGLTCLNWYSEKHQDMINSCVA